MVSKGKIKSKTKFPKSSKKSWRITDIKDVEEFYEDKLLEERLGGPFSEKADEELFFIQKDPEPEKSKKKPVRLTRQQKKQRALLEPPKYLTSLENTSLVPDPISKRNRMKTKEERKSNIQKDIERKLREKGIVKRKEALAAKNRLLNKKFVKLSKPQPYRFSKDVWGNEKDNENKDWLDENTVRHFVTNTGKLEVKAPKSVTNKPSNLPSIETPHPGISYNPTKRDHRALLLTVAEREMKMIKAEEHLARVTTGMFRKIPREKAMENWMEEMSQGLNNNDEEVDEDNTEYKPVNPPALLKRKPLKKKKKLKLLKKEKVERQKKLVEKKKIADVYKLRIMEREIAKTEEDQKKKEERRQANKGKSLLQAKRLGQNKYEEPLIAFQRPHEIRRNLRCLNTEDTILKDRFHSLQKRNIIETRVKLLKTKKHKVKKFKKPGFKEIDFEKSYDDLKL